MKRAVGSLGCSIMFVASTWIVGHSSAAEPTVPTGASTTQLVNVISAPTTAWREITDTQVATARGRATQAAQALDLFLSRGTEENRTAWQQFLDWESLQAQLQAAEPDPGVLGEVLAKLASGEQGLELPQFVDLRNSLLALRRVVQAKHDADINARYNEQISSLENSLQQAESLTDPQLLEVATQLEWLEQLGQAPELVAHGRGQFSRPNLWVSASSSTVSRGFSEPVSETTQLNEMILGTHICGTAHTSGTLNARLLPCSSGAAIELRMSGITHSNTVGRQSPVTIRSRGVTNVLARKRLIIDPLGIRSEPACATCT
ncbi:MAG: hypothetical protein KDB23_02265, partial [Planctomycetales bacterium]|nr:hypothetical protein [Planctomycetales bacterium]